MKIISNYTNIMSIKNREGLTIVDIARNMGDKETLEWSKSLMDQSYGSD